ncbi:MAG: hypothetical protein E7030_03855 [Akkermansiaceae bacterium]|nr:hypothetical protein [Akkermansiaceae bacterium]
MKKSVFFIMAAMAYPLMASNLPTVDVFGDDADTPAQPSRPEEEVVDDIPNWVNELSNLPAAQRQQYMNQFAAAKWAYSKGSLDMCQQCLDVCEGIYAKNPNVWNLRAAAHLAQKNFDAAEAWLKKVQTVVPDDAVANLNFSLLHLGRGEFEKCISMCDSLLYEIEYKEDMEGLTHALLFRKLVCLVMLNRVDEARAVVKDITPLTFTPLYYYSQSVFAIVAKDKSKTLKEMSTADKIYSRDPYLQTYKQVIQFSGILESSPENFTK